MEKETGIESKSPGPLRDERGQSLIVMLLLLVPVLVLVIGLVYDLVLFHKTTLDFLALRRLKRWALLLASNHPELVEGWLRAGSWGETRKSRPSTSSGLDVRLRQSSVEPSAERVTFASI